MHRPPLGQRSAALAWTHAGGWPWTSLASLAYHMDVILGNTKGAVQSPALRTATPSGKNDGGRLSLRLELQALHLAVVLSPQRLRKSRSELL
jgi:hypothetical protein